MVATQTPNRLLSGPLGDPLLEEFSLSADADGQRDAGEVFGLGAEPGGGCRRRAGEPQRTQPARRSGEVERAALLRVPARPCSSSCSTRPGRSGWPGSTGTWPASPPTPPPPRVALNWPPHSQISPGPAELSFKKLGVGVEADHLRCGFARENLHLQLPLAGRLHQNRANGGTGPGCDMRQVLLGVPRFAGARRVVLDLPQLTLDQARGLIDPGRIGSVANDGELLGLASIISERDDDLARIVAVVDD